MIKSLHRAARLASAGALTLLAASPAVLAAGGGEGWYDDFDKALAAAKEQKKDLLVDFTGSDWCGWCIKLDEEVFSHEVWKEGVKDDYVLVALDFPSTDEVKAKVPNPERNEELKNKFGIRGFPTILLMTSDEDVYGQTGYQRGGPEKYLEHMEELKAGKKKLVEVKDMAARFEAAEGDERWKLFDEGIELYAGLGDGMPFASKLQPLAEWGFEADEDNARGAREKAVAALLDRGVAEEEYLDAATEMDPENKKGLLEKVVGARFGQVSDEDSAKAAVDALGELNAFAPKDKESVFRMNVTAAGWLANERLLNDMERAKEFAAKAIEIGSDDKAALERMKELVG